MAKIFRKKESYLSQTPLPRLTGIARCHFHLFHLIPGAPGGGDEEFRDPRKLRKTLLWRMYFYESI